MTSSTFMWPDLVQDVQKFILEIIPEDDLFQFAQTSKQHLELAHGVAFRRGIESRLQWHKLLAVGTIDPGSLHSTSELILRGKNNRHNDVFAEAARSLFLLAKEKKQVIIEDKDLENIFLIINEGFRQATIVRKAALEMVAIFVPFLTLAQVKSIFINVIDSITQIFIIPISYSEQNFLIDLLQLLVLRLQEEQQFDHLAKAQNIELIDILVKSKPVDQVFRKHLLPALTHVNSSNFYQDVKSVEIFIKLSKYLSENDKQIAAIKIHCMLTFATPREARGMYRIMQAIAPDRLMALILDGISAFKHRILETSNLLSQAKRKDCSEADLKSWEQACQALGAMASVMMPNDLDDVVPRLASMLIECSITEKPDAETHEPPINRTNRIYRPTLNLLKDLASCMSDADLAVSLQCIGPNLNHDDKMIRESTLIALAPILRRVSVKQRAPFIPSIIEMFLHDLFLHNLADKTNVGVVLEVLAEDMNDEQVARIIPNLENILTYHLCVYTVRSPKDIAKSVLTLLISRMPIAQLLERIPVWRNNSPWLFVSSLDLRMADLGTDVLMEYMPRVIQALRLNSLNRGTGIFKMAQNIIISFTSRPNVILPEEMISNIFKTLKDPFRVEAFNVWCHLRSLRHYNLRPLSATLPRKGGLSELIYFLDEASDVLQSTPDVKDSLVPTQSEPIVYTGHRFFRIISKTAMTTAVTPVNDEVDRLRAMSAIANLNKQ